MATIHHRTPGYSGAEVVATRSYDFVNGVADAEVNASESVALRVRGHRVETGASSPAPAGVSRPAMPEPELEIGADVAITEDVPPEIG